MLTSLTPAIVIVIGFALVFAVQRSVSSRFDYQCGSCGTVFSLEPLAATVAPHIMGRKWVRCPSCGTLAWSSPVMPLYLTCRNPVWCSTGSPTDLPSER